MNNHNKEINKSLIAGWLLIAGILFVSYLGEVIKGERTIEYFLVFMAVTGIPPIVAFILYRKKPDMKGLMYFIVAGYFPMYLFVMFTGSTSMVFCYILPMLSFLVLYHRPNLILFTGIASICINLISVISRLLNGSTPISQTKDIEIQIALIFLCFLGAYVATNLYDQITLDNERYIKMLDDKNAEIQEMALQTIMTIANTIDAKDTYTKGHSRRVSEYSAAIASELGMSDSEIHDIRSIALLHDIGKIGIPDSVLNKPGRLTDEEFGLMKLHTVRGAEILKDINMIPGIAVGAKYHHERYNGTGYPEGIAGEDIPFIARIIAVADAYDAMNSNRIYRKHLDEEKIIDELEKCSGTQFDPDIAAVFIKILKTGKIEQYHHDGEGDDENVRILTRVMEKHEEKFREGGQTDELTGLLTRSIGEKQMKEAIEKGNGCFMLIDIDNFKRINAQFGFITGDLLIKAVSESILNINADKIVSRFGGDEFSVFLKGDLSEDEIYQIVNKFISDSELAVSSFFTDDKISFSIGIAIVDKPSETFYDLLLNADKALYAARQNQDDKCAKCVIYKHNIQYSEHFTSVDLDKLVRNITNKGSYKGGFQVEYSEFSGVYNLIKKIAERNKQQIQLVMFTLEENGGAKVSVEERDNVMNILEIAIVGAVRGVDVTTKFSSTQRLVLLLNTSAENVEIVITRILMEFYKMYGKKEMNVFYDTARISVNDEDK